MSVKFSWTMRNVGLLLTLVPSCPSSLFHSFRGWAYQFISQLDFGELREHGKGMFFIWDMLKFDSEFLRLQHLMKMLFCLLVKIVLVVKRVPSK